MLVIGRKWTISPDGFSYLRSDLPELQFSGDEHKVYEDAIGSQDMAFLGACQGKNGFIPWKDTMSLIRVVGKAQRLSMPAAEEQGQADQTGEQL
jgi:hypothetical protein